MYAFAIFFWIPRFVNLIFRLGSSFVFWWKGQESVKKDAGQLHGADYVLVANEDGLHPSSWDIAGA